MTQGLDTKAVIFQARVLCQSPSALGTWGLWWHGGSKSCCGYSALLPHSSCFPHRAECKLGPEAAQEQESQWHGMGIGWLEDKTPGNSSARVRTGQSPSRTLMVQLWLLPCAQPEAAALPLPGQEHRHGVRMGPSHHPRLYLTELTNLVVAGEVSSTMNPASFCPVGAQEQPGEEEQPLSSQPGCETVLPKHSKLGIPFSLLPTPAPGYNLPEPQGKLGLIFHGAAAAGAAMHGPSRL